MVVSLLCRVECRPGLRTDCRSKSDVACHLKPDGGGRLFSNKQPVLQGSKVSVRKEGIIIIIIIFCSGGEGLQVHDNQRIRRNTINEGLGWPQTFKLARLVAARSVKTQ